MPVLTQDQLGTDTLPQIRTTVRHYCYLCGEEGRVLHQDLRDRLYSAPGVWSLYKCLNPTCRLVWLNPVPLVEDIGIAYRGYFTHDGDYRSWKYRLLQKIKLGLAGLLYGYRSQTTLGERLLAVPFLFTPFLAEKFTSSACMCLPGNQVGKVLEIGCGKGILLDNMRRLGWEVEGVDFDPEAVAAVRRNFNLNVHVGSVAEQNYADNSFDAIVLSHLIEHVHDPRALLSECKRILKPGGKLALLTPNIESFGYRKLGQAWISLDPPRHLYLFSLTTIRTLVEGAGLTVTNLSTATRYVNAGWLVSKRIAREGKWHPKPRPGIVAQLRAKLFQVREKLASYRNVEAGEEITLTARK